MKLVTIQRNLQAISDCDPEKIKTQFRKLAYTLYKVRDQLDREDQETEKQAACLRFWCKSTFGFSQTLRKIVENGLEDLRKCADQFGVMKNEFYNVAVGYTTLDPIGIPIEKIFELKNPIAGKNAPARNKN